MACPLASLTVLLISLAFLASSCGGDNNELILGATTSIQDPGLLDEIVRAFEGVTDYHLKPSVGGSAEVLEKARRGELDVIMTHSPADEDKFIADSEGLDKRPVMQNLFIVAGPDADPAGVRDAGSMSEAFKRISATQRTFISRGDQSGTHMRELSIWAELSITPQGQSWYQESSTGQGQNLIVASDKDAYTLVDSSTFTVFEKRIGLRALVPDTEKPNVYSVIRVASDKHQNVNATGAIAFAEFITSPAGQCVIADFGTQEYGKSLFEPAGRCPSANVGR